MKKQYRYQASSGRAASEVPNAAFGTNAFNTPSSVLSHVYEPPDLSSISDSNVVVYLKGVMKRDGTTKAKALEDIHGFISKENVKIEEGLILAWTALYPRLSIDTTRRVRQLAHVVTAKIVILCGKRIAPYLPSIIPAWLCGNFDSDRIVAKAAQDALLQAFKTQIKIRDIWRLFQKQIAEYCRDAVLFETPTTLTDERTVNKDEVDATYYRVITTCIVTLDSCISILPAAELETCTEIYSTVVHDKKFVDFSFCPDAALRRAVLVFYRKLFQKYKIDLKIDISALGTRLIDKALAADQTTTATDLIRLLTGLTKHESNIWTTEYKGKKPAEDRFRKFLAKGSQMSFEYWPELSSLIGEIPHEIVVKRWAEMLASIVEGIRRKETRQSANAAWDCYFDSLDHIISNLDTAESKILLDTSSISLIKAYLNAVPTEVVLSQEPIMQLRRALIYDHVKFNIGEIWPNQTSLIIEDLEKAHATLLEKSTEVEQQGLHMINSFTNVQLAILESKDDKSATEQSMWQMVQTQNQILGNAAIESLKTTKGESKLASSILKSISGFGDLVTTDLRERLTTFMHNDVPGMLLSGSRPNFVALLYSQSLPEDCVGIWNTWADALFRQADSIDRNQALLDLASNEKGRDVPSVIVEAAKTHIFYQKFLQSLFLLMASHPDSLEHIAQERQALSLLHTQGKLTMIKECVEKLHDNMLCLEALHILQAIQKIDPSLLSTQLKEPLGLGLMSRLITLEKDNNQDVSTQAQILHTLLGGSSGANSTLNSDIIRNELSQAPMSSSLAMSVVSAKTGEIIKSDSSALVEIVRALVPCWTNALQECLTRLPSMSLSLTNELGGAIYFVQTSPNSLLSKTEMSYDADGLGQSLRIAIFVQTINLSLDIHGTLNEEERSKVAMLLNTTAALTEDARNLRRKSDVWQYPCNREGNDHVNQFLANMHKMQFSTFKLDENIQNVLDSLTLTEETNQSIMQYYQARVLIKTSSRTDIARQDSGFVNMLEKDVDVNRKADNIPMTCGNLVVLSQFLDKSAYLTRFCNELVSRLTEVDPLKDTDQVLQKLVMLNIILTRAQSVDKIVNKQRLIFLTQHIVPWITNNDMSPLLVAEVCKLLTSILPSIIDVYGAFWNQILVGLCSNWSNNGHDASKNISRLDEARLIMLDSSLRLLAILNSLTNEESVAEDLTDAFGEHAEAISSGLLTLLVNDPDVADEDNIPIMMMTTILCQRILKLVKVNKGMVDELYPLLDSPSRTRRQVAFRLLDGYLGPFQEQLSVDAALDNNTVHLPEELLSFVMSAPDLGVDDDDDGQTSLVQSTKQQSQLETYQYCWLLIFSQFKKASFKVKEDYIEDIKSGDHLTPLLDLIFDHLIDQKRRQPIEIDHQNFDAVKVSSNTEETGFHTTTHIILNHLFYLCLLHLSSLTKSHFLTISNRQISNAILEYTAKNISPQILNASFEDLSTWTSTFPSKQDEYENFSIKAYPRAKEIIASFIVDDQTMSIIVRLPDSYPLTGAKVEGISRVAVDGKKWESWRRNCQGVITFSNGNIIDGLQAWRKNVQGALKGAAECAICYSIVSAEKSLPNKKCGTCKNLFHAGCLFKWFKTSNGSTCPLCRNQFNYG